MYGMYYTTDPQRFLPLLNLYILYVVDLKKQMVISMPECHSRLYLVVEIVFLLCLDN